jgi:hypothetical protein
MLFACCITKAINTQSEYVVFTALPPQRWLLELASMLRYRYIAFLFFVTDLSIDMSYLSKQPFIYSATVSVCTVIATMK